MKIPTKLLKPRYSNTSQQWPQYLSVASAAIAGVGAGLHFGWPSPAIPKMLASDFPFAISEEQSSYVAAVGPFAYVIGGPLSAYFVDIIGRKKTLLLLAIPQIIAWLLIATSNSVAQLLVARLIAGFGEGALFTVLPIYCGEVSEPKIRGVLGTSLSVSVISGILLINCYGSYMSIATSAYISMVIPLLFVATFIWMPESPYFYLMKGRIDKARKSLKALRRMIDVENELSKLTADVQRQISEPGTFKDIFAIDHNRRAFLVLLGLRTLHQSSGVSAFGLYTQVIFKQAGDDISPSVSSIIYTATQVVITFFGSILADRYGRKPLVISSCVGTGLVLIVEGLYFYFKDAGFDVSSFKWLPITGMMIYVIIVSVGLGVAPNLMMSELFSTSVKAKALGLMNIYFAFCISTSTKLFQTLEHYFSMCVPFLIFGTCCLFGVIFSYYYIPETKGKSLEEIQQMLKKSDNKNKAVITSSNQLQ